MLGHVQAGIGVEQLAGECWQKMDDAQVIDSIEFNDGTNQGFQVFAADSGAKTPILDDFLGVGILVQLEADHQGTGAGAGFENGPCFGIRLCIIQQERDIAESSGFTPEVAELLDFGDDFRPQFAAFVPLAHRGANDEHGVGLILIFRVLGQFGVKHRPRFWSHSLQLGQRGKNMDERTFFDQMLGGENGLDE